MGEGLKPAWMPDTIGEWIFWIFVAFAVMMFLDVLAFPNRDLLGELSPWLDKLIDFVGGLIEPLKEAL